MSLLNKSARKDTNREVLAPESEVRAKINEENRQRVMATQKKHRERYLEDWKQEKALIDDMDNEALRQYLSEQQERTIDPRVGLHSMKINPFEHALIKLAINVSGSRSSRELFVNYCKEVIKKSN